MCKRLWLTALLLAGAASAADTSWLGLLPANTGFVMGISVGRIRATPFGRELSERMEQQLGALQIPAGPAALGLFNSIDDVTIAFSTVGGDRGLVVMRGDFSRGVYDEWIQPQAVSTALVQGVRVTTLKPAKSIGASKAPAALAYLDGGLIVGGDVTSVRQAIARRARPAAIAPALAERAGELRAAHDLWLVARVPPEGLSRQANASPQVQRALAVARSVEQISIGINLGTTLDLAAELIARTPEDADAMANGLRLLMSMAASGKDEQTKALAPVLQQIDVRPEGKLIKLNLSLTQEQLKQLTPAAGRPGAVGQSAPKANVDPNEVIIHSSPKEMGTVRIRK